MPKYFIYRNHPQSTVECSHSSSVYSNMMNIITMNLADQVGLNNASNQVEAEAGEKLAEIDNTTSQPPETYTAATPTIQWPETYAAATPAIHPPETSSPNKMKGVGVFI
ncbi:hypothetical protein AMTR_s00028p00146480 [Amborella trichopoda]|uniref:Uncharacterized protein n=1 Tax=Amborella trichopoda TaxID=13333 RepID=W1PKQ9_AMBTC|nr:hypothetical protein AMTR_s00028p00146480 [Amborella trichopoda]